MKNIIRLLHIKSVVFLILFNSCRSYIDTKLYIDDYLKSYSNKNIEKYKMGLFIDLRNSNIEISDFPVENLKAYLSSSYDLCYYYKRIPIIAAKKHDDFFFDRSCFVVDTVIVNEAMLPEIYYNPFTSNFDTSYVRLGNEFESRLEIIYKSNYEKIMYYDNLFEKVVYNFD